MNPQRQILMRSPRVLIGIGVLCWLPGCGSGDWGTVTGSVNFKSKALTTGIVTFHPVSKEAVAYGAITAQGTFNIMTGAKAGLKTGVYKITVVDETIPKMGTKEVLSRETAVRLTPAKYASAATTDLSVTIHAGVNVVELVLEE